MESPIPIIFLIRSYNRPDYLLKTIKSVLTSDIDLSLKRYIYDDSSTDELTLELLSNQVYMSVTGKEFIVVKNQTNRGCKFSYIDALNYVKKDNEDINQYIICTVDNDVEVNTKFISTLYSEYKNASQEYNQHVLLTGFNASNAHKNFLKDHTNFYRKKSIGGVNILYFIVIFLIL